MALYDLSQLKEISGGDESFMESILDTFKTEMPQMLNELKAAYSAGDLQTVGQKAHKMKSSIDLMGIADLKQTIRSIEKQGKSNTDDDLPELIQNTENVLKAVLNEL